MTAVNRLQESASFSTLVSMPPWGQPRYLLPTRGRSAWIAAQIFTAGQSRVTSRALRGIARSGLLSLLPRATGDGIDSAVIAELQFRLPWITDIAVYFGPRRANAKPVLALMSDDRVAAVAKVGDKPLTRQLVLHETEVLRAEVTRSHAQYCAPKVLDAFSVGETAVLVLSAFDLRESTPGGATGQRRTEWIEMAHAIARPRPAQPLGGTDWWIQTTPQLSDLARRNPALRRLDDHLRRLADVMVVPSASHGDFTQWNARRLQDGWAVWDWERQTESSIWGFDILHWELFARLRGGLAGACDQIRRSHRSILSGTGIGTQDSGVVAFLYLTDLAVRFETDQQAAAPTVTAAAVAAASEVGGA